MAYIQLEIPLEKLLNLRPNRRMEESTEEEMGRMNKHPTPRRRRTVIKEHMGR